jgi:hypothetical protein
MSNSELLKNVERSMYTFNFNNIVELCFDKVITNESKLKGNKLNDKERVAFDNCIDKYMLSFNIVKEEAIEHLEKIFNNKRN